MISKNIRLEAEKVKDKLKEQINRDAKTIDGENKYIREACQDIEATLKEKENFFAIQEQKRITVIAEDRHNQLKVYTDELVTGLGEMPEDQFNAMLAGYKFAKQEAERIVKEAAELAEKKRLEEIERQKAFEVENERLKAEAEVNEKRNNELRPYIVFIRDYTKTLELSEEDYKKELTDLKRAAKEQIEFEVQQKAEAEAERKEQESKDKAAQIERDKAAATAKKLQDEAAAKQKEIERIKTEQAAKEQAAKDEESKRLKDQEESAQAALKAPDKEKLIALAEIFDTILLPILSSKKGAETIAKIQELQGRLVTYIQDKSDELWATYLH